MGGEQLGQTDFWTKDFYGWGAGGTPKKLLTENQYGWHWAGKVELKAKTKGDTPKNILQLLSQTHEVALSYLICAMCNVD